jgi:hypothetical protein
MNIPATALVTARTPATPSQVSFSAAIDAFTEAHGAEAMAKYQEIAHYRATK